MSFQQEAKGEKAFLKIDGSLSIYQASALQQALIECFETCNTIAIDLKDVTDCDITGVQLLHSARMTANATGKTFEITAISPATTKALGAAGLNPEICSRDPKCKV